MQDFSTFISNHPLLFAATIVVLVILMMIELIRNKRNIFQLSPLQVTQKINHDNALVVDIRDKESYQKGHITSSLSIPLQDFKTLSQKLAKHKARSLIFVCTTGAESQKIAAQWLKQGYNAYSLAGGIRSWNDAQMPLVKES